MAHSENRNTGRKPRRSRPRVQQAGRSSHPDGRGEDWGDDFRSRLRRLIADQGRTNIALAKRCGFDSPRVTGWLAGDQLPSAEHLRRLARGTGVSVDWLLFGDDDAPMYRGQSRGKAELEADLSAAVARSMSPEVSPLLKLGRIDARTIIEDAARTADREAKASGEWLLRMHASVRRGARNVFAVAASLSRQLPRVDLETRMLLTVGRVCDVLNDALRDIGTNEQPGYPQTQAFRMTHLAVPAPTGTGTIRIPLSAPLELKTKAGFGVCLLAMIGAELKQLGLTNAEWNELARQTMRVIRDDLEERSAGHAGRGGDHATQPTM